MHKDLKQEILETARRMFNDHGYNGVSMRDLAGELGISVGNLTYHFKRKEELMEAVQEEQFKGYFKAEPMDGLEDLDAFFQRRLAYQRKNPYYFRHYTQLAQISTRIYEMQRQVISDMYDILRRTFDNLKRRGLMAPDALPGQTENLIQALSTICYFGMALGEENRLACLWSLIYPTLTEQGRAEYRAIEEKTRANP